MLIPILFFVLLLPLLAWLFYGSAITDPKAIVKQTINTLSRLPEFSSQFGTYGLTAIRNTLYDGYENATVGVTLVSTYIGSFWAYLTDLVSYTGQTLVSIMPGLSRCEWIWHLPKTLGSWIHLIFLEGPLNFFSYILVVSRDSFKGNSLSTSMQSSRVNEEELISILLNNPNFKKQIRDLLSPTEL